MGLFGSGLRRWRAPVSVVSVLVAAVSAAGCSSTQKGGGVRGFYTLTGGEIVVDLQPDLVSELQATGVDLSAVAPARTPNAQVFHFPVVGGSLRIGSLAGTVDSAGALLLARPGGPSTQASGLNASSGIVTAVIGGRRQALLTYRVPYVLHRGNQYLWSGADATLSTAAAEALNRALGVSVLSHRVIGTVAVTVAVTAPYRQP